MIKQACGQADDPANGKLPAVTLTKHHFKYYSMIEELGSNYQLNINRSMA